jgi:purine-binding chemotaxis protein CheW
MIREIQFVGFTLGRETYGIPITLLQEIVRVPEITAVPDSPDFLEGVINLRGKIVSVVDLRKRFGKPATPLARGSRVLVVAHRGRLAGMIVDSASQVLRIPENDIESAPALMQEGGLDCVTGLGKHNGQLVILLDIDKVLAGCESDKTSPQRTLGDKSADTSADTSGNRLAHRTEKENTQKASAGRQ